MPDPLSLRLTGGLALVEGQLSDTDIAIADGCFVANAARCVDATGYLLLPGIIDVHGDGHERHFAPRRGAQNDAGLALHTTQAELAANGITTAMLAQFYSWEGGMRGPDFATMVSEAIASTHTLTDLHTQLRVEIGLHAQFSDIARLIERVGIRYVVLNDHIPHAALAAGKRPPRLTGQALKSGRSPDAHLEMLHALHADMDAARAALPAFTTALQEAGVRVGSHDDKSAQDRAQSRAWGAHICEFPETYAAAEEAKAHGEPVIMGAPNVVRGGSHDKKVSAMALLDDGLIDALVSDYHYPALQCAALKLWDAGMDLDTAWGLVSSGPARILDWTDRGRIALGLRADLAVMNAQTRRVEATICAGHVTHLTGEFASRMVAS